MWGHFYQSQLATWQVVAQDYTILCGLSIFSILEAASQPMKRNQIRGSACLTSIHSQASIVKKLINNAIFE